MSRDRLLRLQQIAFIVGAAGFIAAILGLITAQTQFFRAYLLGFAFWIGPGLGCFAVLMFHHVIGGRWGYAVRDLLAAGTRTLIVMAVLFLPVLFGLPQLYEWAQPDIVAESFLLQHKFPFLNVPFFIVRAAIYFVLWVALGWWLTRPAVVEHRSRLAAPGLILFMFTVTFAAVDWVMSLEAGWYSSIYGFLLISCHVLSGFALVLTAFPILKQQQAHDSVLWGTLASWLLVFLLAWAYMMFMQYLVIWAGNIPQEVQWYIQRTRGGWEWVVFIVVVFNLVLPFTLLLIPRFRRHSKTLAIVAAMILIAQMVQMFWLVVPAFAGGQFRLHWLDLAVPVGIGGVWVAAFIYAFRRMQGASYE